MEVKYTYSKASLAGVMRKGFPEMKQTNIQSILKNAHTNRNYKNIYRSTTIGLLKILSLKSFPLSSIAFEKPFLQPLTTE